MSAGWDEEPGRSDKVDSRSTENGSRPNGKTKRMSLANERAAKAVEMRHVESKTFQQIGTELGITPQAAKAAYDRGVKMLVPTQQVDEARQAALAKLDRWEQMMMEEYYRGVVMVNFGKVIYDKDPKTHEDATPILDYAHRKDIMDRLIKIERERRSIMGYQAPSKRVLEVVTQDVFDKAIRQLNAEAAALEEQSAQAERERGSAAIGPHNDPNVIDAEVVEEED